jgi:surface antigen
MAFGSLGSEAVASASHSENSRNGSAALSRSLSINENRRLCPQFAMCVCWGVFMHWSGSSYIGAGRQRQSPPYIRLAAIALLAAMLGGCAGLGMPFESASRDTMTTGSIQKVSAKAGGSTAPSDWEAVRSTIAGAMVSKTEAVAWRNPSTGSNGELSILNTSTATNDGNCRNFVTTMNDMRGIRRYRGEACKMANGRWQLFGVLADDSKLL